MNRLPELRLRLAELVRMRTDYAAQGKPHFVEYVDRLISQVERELAAARGGTALPTNSERG